MKAIHIKKSKFGFQYCQEPFSSAPTWRYFGPDVKNSADMKAYFEKGKHSNSARDSLRDIDLFFVDDDGKPTNFYTPAQSDNDTTLITVNYDRTRRLPVTASDVWSEAERLAYLREHAIYLPSDIDNTSAALEYLKQNEYFTTEIYNSELETRTAAAIERACNEHAAQYRRSAIIDG